jgi:hypothetical protein
MHRRLTARIAFVTLHPNAIIYILNAHASVGAVFDGMFGTSVADRTFQRDVPLRHCYGDFTHIKPAMAELLAYILPYTLVGARISLGTRATRTIEVLLAVLAAALLPIALHIQVPPWITTAARIMLKLLSLEARIFIGKAAVAALAGIGTATVNVFAS